VGVVFVKDGVQFSKIAPGGLRILSAVDQSAAVLDFDVWITSACDGAHSGPDDPHHRGEAYDLRTHDFTETQKDALLDSLYHFLGYTRFYAFRESPGEANEHIHVQVKKGTVFP
jgi:hypothetical protein